MKKLLSCIFVWCVALVSQLQGSNINWSPSPAILSSMHNNAVDPQLAIDGSGNIIAAWIENGIVLSSSKLVDGDWTPSIGVSAGGGSSVRLVSDLNGNATVVWIENGVVKSSSKALNGSWSSPITLSLTQYNDASSLALGVGSAGDVVAAWVRNGNVETATKLFGKAWQSRVIISSSSASTPSVAVGGPENSTTAVITWRGLSSGVNVVYASRKSITGSWGKTVTVSELAHHAVNPAVAIDSNANALAVWYSYDKIGQNYGNVVVKSAGLLASSDNWNAVVELSNAGLRNPAALTARVAFDTTGNAIASWNNSYDDETFTLESAVKPVFGQWSESVQLVDANLYTYSADLALTSFGDVLSLYMFYNSANLLIQSVESDINGFQNNIWSVPLTISLGTNNGKPKIAATLVGNEIRAVAVWLHFDGVNNTLVASTGAKTLVAPPTNLSVVQGVNNFGVFSEYFNTVSWQASLDPHVVGYLVFRNGVFIGQVGADTLQFVDDNRVSNGSVTYSVASIDLLQTQSRMVSVNFP